MGNPLVVDVANLAAFSPAETTELISRIGVRKGNMRPDKVFLSAISAGCLLSFGCAVSLTALTAPWYQENAPGLIKLIGASVFPLGLVMVVLTGADLFTATTMASWAHSAWLSLSTYKEEVIAFATKKQITPQMHQIFLRAIGCNWLVCLAVFLGTQAKDLSSKIIGMWWPIFAFVSLGLDHVVANMFFMPMGIWLHTPGLSVGLYIWKGIIPTALGNVIGGSLFCGVYYWYMYLLFDAPVKVDGVEYQGPVVGTHLSFLDLRRKSAATTDEESRIESRQVSHSQ